jgi:hypothetical protein
MERDGAIRSDGGRRVEIDLAAVERDDRDDVACSFSEEAERYPYRLPDSELHGFKHAVMTFAVFRLPDAIIDYHLKRFFVLRSKPAEGSRLRGNVSYAETAFE